jgi:hypothetical protein
MHQMLIAFGLATAVAAAASAAELSKDEASTILSHMGCNTPAHVVTVVNGIGVQQYGMGGVLIMHPTISGDKVAVALGQCIDGNGKPAVKEITFLYSDIGWIYYEITADAHIKLWSKTGFTDIPPPAGK